MTTLCGLPLLDDDELFDRIAADRSERAGDRGLEQPSVRICYGMLLDEDDLWDWLVEHTADYGNDHWPKCQCQRRSTCCNDHVLVRHSNGRMAIQERHHETGAPVNSQGAP